MTVRKIDTLVLGGGPGGYTAAFRAADLGQKPVIVEERPTLGGVCLNEGCIPSKSYLHIAQVIHDGKNASSLGADFGHLKLNLGKIRSHKKSVVEGLTKGLAGLAEKRGVEIFRGKGRFTGENTLLAEGEESCEFAFGNAIIATGSRVVRLPLFPFEDPRVMDSSDALELPDIPGRLLIVGGGIIGMEMATVYSSFGSQVSVVELTDQIIPPADADLVKPLMRMYRKRLDSIMVSTKVTSVEALPEGIRVSFEGGKKGEALAPQVYDRILVGVGRQPNTEGIGLEQLGLETDQRGFIPVDGKRMTGRTNIYAVGDVTGSPMLAHKAVHEGKVAAEAIGGLPAAFDPACIPSVAYTDPELAWTGLTEKQARIEKIPYEVGVFPWAASGRSLSLGRNEGKTKILYDPESQRVLGAGIVGTNGGELIAEAGLAIEMGADLTDLALTVHPHPTLSETLGLAAEAGEGTLTDL